MDLNEKIKVAICEDHAIVVDGLHSILEKEEDINVVGTATNGDELIDLLSQTKTDVVILDINMPGKNGMEISEYLKENFDLEILVLSMFDSEEFIRRVLKAGAKGYILKNENKKNLIRAIHSVYRGKKYFSEEIQDKINEMVAEKPVEGKTILSIKELEVLKLVALGKSTKQIAAILNRSESTISTHRANIKQKTGLVNPSEITMYAVEKGYIHPDAGKTNY